MVTRILPEHDWPRIAETGCVVDKAWESTATRGCVITTEIGRKIIATAFVFLAGDSTPHVDGLWIDHAWRGKVAVLRGLYRGVKFAVDHLGGDHRIPIEAAVWMTRPERRQYGVELV
jgi:hypothetical protein